MKKIVSVFLCLISLTISVFCFGGCADIDNQKLSVWTSFYPIYDFAKKICGDKANVYNLVPAGAEPHDYEISAGEMAKMYDSDVIFVNGLGLEVWLDYSRDDYGVPQELFDKIRVTSDVEGLDLIYADSSTVDPHIWLNVNYAKKQMEYIKNIMCELDSANSNYYTKNYLKYELMFDGLDISIKKNFLNLNSDTIVVAHEAYSYFCKAYNLKQVAVNGLNADNEPSSQQISNIIEQICGLVRTYNMTTIFYEELLPDNVMKTIKAEVQKETGVEVKLENLCTLEGLTNEDLKNNQDYFSKMAENAVNIRNALS